MSPGTSLNSSIEHGVALDLLLAFLLQQGQQFFGRTVNGVVNIEILQRIIVLRCDLDVDFSMGLTLASLPGLVIRTVGLPTCALSMK